MKNRNLKAKTKKSVDSRPRPKPPTCSPKYKGSLGPRYMNKMPSKLYEKLLKTCKTIIEELKM